MDVAAGVGAAFVLLAVVAFQLATVLGAPVGRFTQGGRHEGKLPPGNRVFAALSVLVLSALAAITAGKVGRGPLATLSTGLLTALWWITVVYLSLGVVLNLASRSRQERLVFAPVSALVLLLTVASVVL